MHKFKELIMWQKSRTLVKDVYLLTKSFPSEEKFGLTSQVQRAAVSVPSNIAEGSGRSSNKDFGHFLDIAISSAFELETQLILSSDLGYIKDDELYTISSKVDEIQKMINSFKKQLTV